MVEQLLGILIIAQIPSIREFYPFFYPARQGGAVFWGFEAAALLSMASWEFINHGYLTLGLKERLGLLSVVVGAIPFGILHFGKPTLEIYWSVFDGMGLALLAYACGSIWPGVWLHGVGAFLLDVTLVYITPPRPPLH
ncbi:MAG: type II CAAX prenyl endopeptidase Rce1 family protein [Isosphaeraceae bacterium]